MSCYVQWDYIRPGLKSIALCGELVAPQDIANEPTCPACRTELARTAEDVFGPEPSRAERLAAVRPAALRVVGPSIKRRDVA